MAVGGGGGPLEKGTIAPAFGLPVKLAGIAGTDAAIGEDALVTACCGRPANWVRRRKLGCDAMVRGNRWGEIGNLLGS